MKHYFIFLFLLLCFGSCQSIQDIEKPNVLFILVDQWRGSALGYAGDPNVKTPNLDEFAQEATNFTNAVSVCPVCTPYRASLMTGRYPTTTGMFLNDAYLPPEELCLAEVFKANGYSTGYIGKWHLDGHGRHDYTPPERRQGFDFWMALECSHEYNKMRYYENDSPEMKIWEGYSPFALSKVSSNYIDSARIEEQPFFLFISFATPHFPHATAPEEYKTMYPPDQLKLNPNVPVEIHEQVKSELSGYYAHCSATDKAIGDLLDKIRIDQLMQNTIIIFTSDHGEVMGAHSLRIKQKQVPYIEAAGVPFLIHTPSNTIQNMAVDFPITTPDISTTLLALAGIEIPASFEGEDFSSILRGDNLYGDRAALYMCVSPFSLIRPEFKKEYRAIKTNRFSYVRDIDGPWLLFDDVEDPFQMANLVKDSANTQIQLRLDHLLMQELKKIGDDFRPAETYLDEWGYEVTPNGHIPYQMHNQGKVQSPKRKNSN